MSLNGGDDTFTLANGVSPGRLDGGTGTDILGPENGTQCLDIAATLNVSYTCTVAFPGETLTYRVAMSGFETYGGFYADAPPRSPAQLAMTPSASTHPRRPCVVCKATTSCTPTPSTRPRLPARRPRRRPPRRWQRPRPVFT